MGFVEDDRRDGCFGEANGMRGDNMLPRVGLKVNHWSFRSDLACFLGCFTLKFCFAVGRSHASFPSLAIGCSLPVVPPPPMAYEFSRCVVAAPNFYAASQYVLNGGG